jgi:AcrR family transcriptional regulator
MNERRDAARSRQSILDAAERLFAEQGFERTTLEQIGQAAGLSRGTPRYFFGPKEHLYRTVLARLFGSLEQLARDIAHDAATSGGGLTDLVAAAVRRRIDFLVTRPTFIKLQEREALSGSELLAMFPPQVQALEVAIAAVQRTMPGSSREDAALAVLSVIALTSYAFAHPDLVQALGLDPHHPAFVQALEAHVTRLLVRGLDA